MIQKINIMLLAVVILFILSGCSVSNEEIETSASESSLVSSEDEISVMGLESSDQSQFIWKIEIEDVLNFSTLENEEGIVQYDGSIAVATYTEEASIGKEYILVNLTIAKQHSGNNSFEWSDLFLIDSDGNAYERMENDVFLTNFNYERLPGTSLKIGENSGWICFEVPTESVSKLNSLVHKTQDGDNIIYF